MTFCGKSKVYIGELIYIFMQKLVGRAIYLRSEHDDRDEFKGPIQNLMYLNNNTIFP